MASPEPTEQESVILPNAVAPAATDTIEDVEWYISSTGSIHFGGTGYSGSDDTTLQPFSNRVVSLDTNDRMLLSYVNTEGPEYFYNVASDYTVDLTTAADYSSASLGKLVITGTIDMTYYLYVSYKTQTNTSTSMTRYFNPESVSLLINDEVYGDPIEITSGGSVEVNWEVDLSQISNVSSYGFRFSFSGGNHSYSLSGNLSRLEVGMHWNPEDLSIAGQDVTVGLLDSILNLLRTIVSSIVNLPGNIASAIGNILQSLFVPSQEDLTGIVSQYQTLFEDRLGFIWQAGEWVVDFGSTVLSALQSGDDYTFQFPGLSVPLGGQTYTILSPTTVSMDNAFMDWARPVAGTAVGFICVVAFVNMCSDMVEAVVSGASYFEFLKRGGRHD